MTPRNLLVTVTCVLVVTGRRSFCWGLSLDEMQVVLDRALPASVANRTIDLQPGMNACHCRNACFVVLACQVATFEVLNGMSVCHLYQYPVPVSLLAKWPSSVTFFFRGKGYELVGRRFYRFVGEGLASYPSSDFCIADGAQLVVADTEEKMQELTSFVTRQGVRVIWIRMKITKAIFDSRGDPIWIYGNGTKVPQPGTAYVTRATCFYYKLDDNGKVVLSNMEYKCSQPLPFVCQKE